MSGLPEYQVIHRRGKEFAEFAEFAKSKRNLDFSLHKLRQLCHSAVNEFIFCQR